MTLEELKALKDSGEFHHATYRNQRTLWEGLWIYRKDQTGFRGYRDAGAFLKDSPDLDAAHEIVRDTGISLGQYGAG